MKRNLKFPDFFFFFQFDFKRIVYVLRRIGHHESTHFIIITYTMFVFDINICESLRKLCFTKIEKDRT